MKTNIKDTLGDTCKQYEQAEAGRRSDLKTPMLVRLDGHGFSKFTKGLNKPFDSRFADMMALTARHLLQRSDALAAYTQSDEITLIYAPCTPDQDRLFGGRYQKITSLLAASATGVFNRNLAAYLPEKADAEPEFDCRAWSVPTLQQAVDVLVWREKDAIKNSVSMLASSHFPETRMAHMTAKERRELMLTEKGIDWRELPQWAKRGRFFHRAEVPHVLSAEKLLSIPEKHRPTGPMTRKAVCEWDLPTLDRIENLVDVIFHGKEPVLMLRSWDAPAVAYIEDTVLAGP